MYAEIEMFQTVREELHSKFIIVRGGFTSQNSVFNRDWSTDLPTPELQTNLLSRNCQSWDTHCAPDIWRLKSGVTMHTNWLVHLLALPAYLRFACVAASTDDSTLTYVQNPEKPNRNFEKRLDPIDQAALREACPDYAHYSRTKQYVEIQLTHGKVAR